MDFEVGILIGTSLLLLTPQPSTSIQACTSFADLADPCGCTLTKENFDPLCGSDGNTYLNTCFLQCRQTIDKVTIRVNYKGICTKEGRCTCHANYNPVCGNNGHTYSNDCVLKCHAKNSPSLRLKHNGECDDNRERYSKTHRLRSRITKTCICNPMTGPICATNGVSYANYCVMRCKAEAANDKSIKFAYWGMCSSQEIEPNNEPSIVQLKPRLTAKKQTCNCPMHAISYFTRCGSDKHELALPGCFCMPKSQTMKYEDPCGKEPSRPELDDDRLTMVTSKSCFCAAVHKPVCGSDHQTYANMCVLHCRARKNTNIKFLQWGDCHDVRLVSRLPDQEDDDVSFVRTGHVRSGTYRDRRLF